MRKLLILVLSALFIVAASACSNIDDKASSEGKIIVAVGVVPQATFVQEVAGDLVHVVTLIPPGNSPANYQPTAIGMQELSDAKIYFTMQTPTEEANILPKVNDFNKDIDIVYLRDIISDIYPNRYVSDHVHEEDEHEDEHEGEEESVDPHIWLSPKRVIMMVEIIADKLSEVDSKNAQVYQDNADKYIQELRELDDKIKESVVEISNKTFMIYHGTYGYFADDYGFTMITLENEGKSATAVQMQEVIDYAREHDIKTVYFQEEFDDTQAKTIAQEIDGSVVKVAPLSASYIDELLEFTKALSSQGE